MSGRAELIVVGTGIRPEDHLTPEARQAIESSDIVFYLVHAPAAETYLRGLRSGESHSLAQHYQQGTTLAAIYQQMVETILAPLRAGRRVCFALYGHPGVFVYPSQQAIRLAREQGYEARMLPGISAEDCLFADVGLDPASTGCLSLWANDLLMHHRPIDPTATVILWSIGMVGELAFDRTARYEQAFGILAERLRTVYPPTHPVIIYEAAIESGKRNRIEHVSLGHLTPNQLTSLSTLIIPRCREPLPDYAVMGLLKGNG